jgi:hypothetical protein
MLTMRRAVSRKQKNVADVDENSPMIQPASIQASMAVMNTWVRFAPATSGRDSMMLPCMLRTTYHRGAGVGSSGLKAARRGLIFRKYSACRSGVHPVLSGAKYCMGENMPRSDGVWGSAPKGCDKNSSNAVGKFAPAARGRGIVSAPIGGSPMHSPGTAYGRCPVRWTMSLGLWPSADVA